MIFSFMVHDASSTVQPPRDGGKEVAGQGASSLKIRSSYVYMYVKQSIILIPELSRDQEAWQRVVGEDAR